MSEITSPARGAAAAVLDTPLDAVGVAAPPRKNGELVFAEPWESRVFGIALALHARGLFSWNEFRDALIAEIARWEGAAGSDTATAGEAPSWRYYERWQAALETLLAARGICASDTLSARADDLAARPPGHDHG